MNSHLIVWMVAAVALTLTSPAAAQQPGDAAATAAQRNDRPAIVPLDVQVVIAKYQGEKRISSVPYVLAVNANSTGAQLTIGTEVPVTTTAFAPAPAGDSKAAQPLRSYNYRTVGTVISSSAQSTADGRFELEISIDESSLGTTAPDSPGSPAADMPVFKNFKTRNKLLLRSGQVRQFTAATDRVSGETIRIEVTLTVVK